MNPDPVVKESETEHAVDKWIERDRKPEPHGKYDALAPLYKVMALDKIMVGRLKAYFDIVGGRI